MNHVRFHDLTFWFLYESQILMINRLLGEQKGGLLYKNPTPPFFMLAISPPR